MPASETRKRRGRLWHGTKRWLYLIHRWVGIASCLLFAMWFLSGLVMIYVPYPSLSAGERLAGAQPIDWAQVRMVPHAGIDWPPRALDLEMRDGRAVWRIAGWDGTYDTVAATPGARLAPVDADYARRVAGDFARKPVAAIERIERDQWTVAGGFDRHRPLWKTSLADGTGTQLYVSSSTGAVVQATTRSERFWNWLGSVPHWLYPTVLRQDQEAWRQVVIWVSGPCIAVALTGMWIGILRTRIGKRRFKGGRMVPYHGWMLWHHVAGLVGGLLLTTWIFSGWLSVDPGRLFASQGPDDAAAMRYSANRDLPPVDLAALGRIGAGARRVSITAHAGQALVTLYAADGTRRVVDAATLSAARDLRPRIEQAATMLVPAGHLVASDMLTTPDLYWYEVGGVPQLPVLRLRFNDPARTWLDIDPATGEMLQALDSKRRAYRWAYDMLHKWDLNVLMLHRPLWDLFLWFFSLLGIVTSISGIWIGWKRLRHRPR